MRDVPTIRLSQLTRITVAGQMVLEYLFGNAEQPAADQPGDGWNHDGDAGVEYL